MTNSTKSLKPLDPAAIRLLVVHCTATKRNRPFSVESLIACCVAKYGQCSYHYYVRRNGDVIPVLPESVQGVHARHYNGCSLGIVYEGGLGENGIAADTRTEAQKHSLYELLKELTAEYPNARIIGHCELPKQRVPIELVLDWLGGDGSRQSQLPRVAKKCPCYLPSKEYAELQPEARSKIINP